MILIVERRAEERESAANLHVQAIRWAAFSNHLRNLAEDAALVAGMRSLASDLTRREVGSDIFSAQARRQGALNSTSDNKLFHTGKGAPPENQCVGTISW